MRKKMSEKTNIEPLKEGESIMYKMRKSKFGGSII